MLIRLVGATSSSKFLSQGLASTGRNMCRGSARTSACSSLTRVGQWLIEAFALAFAALPPPYARVDASGGRQLPFAVDSDV